MDKQILAKMNSFPELLGILVQYVAELDGEDSVNPSLFGELFFRGMLSLIAPIIQKAGKDPANWVMVRDKLTQLWPIAKSSQVRDCLRILRVASESFLED